MLMTSSKIMAAIFTVVYAVLIYMVATGQMMGAMYLMAIGMFAESLLCLIHCFKNNK
ncbi:hypothetical protein [Pediococcus argentinicus]|uniref:Uncharacterized protein n=1 Tax=Pediococcus argentinicus TaxID=480391 RepID=A0A0R2NA31_9LACO|nr:hypothetical protein [Pediococcus argentinicus]KRO22729.1 hypothetical protein IV88_GL001114 [Pediococcus argentinicus]NKZ22998.1 hypothetical protein [Pediococcus argentinicus]GEP20085.1 hypothetical protein LSA03_14690 [Pediococcus argentinicus]